MDFVFQDLPQDLQVDDQNTFIWSFRLYPLNIMATHFQHLNLIIFKVATVLLLLEPRAKTNFRKFDNPKLRQMEWESYCV